MTLITQQTFTILVLLSFSLCHLNPICPVPDLMLNDNPELESEMTNSVELKNKAPFKSHKRKMLKFSMKFMLDLYGKMNEDENVDDQDRLKRGSIKDYPRLTDEDVAKAELSDDIISMSCINRKSDAVGQKQKFVFRTSVISSTAQLLGAELKLFQSKKLASMPNASYELSIFMLLDIKNEKKMRRITKKITTLDNDGWLSLDLTTYLKKWMDNRTDTLDLYASARLYGKKDAVEIHPAEIGIVWPDERQVNEPFLVLFLENENIISIRQPRSLQIFKSGKPKFSDLLGKKAACSLNHVTVNFKDLGWQDMVVAPSEYPSAYCYGSCNFPLLPTKVGATNHALVQSLMQLRYPEKFPKPNCAPYGYKKISVLFSWDSGENLRVFKNAIPKACACQ
ncbi:hypothetical protein ABEB36_007219 [Hypothenemus hampei]|uniref:TGF-beta family profile domain-containing protein n=1 Tax=Hypothenemus hampei TaxID=57062 RepID=A0ABD1ETC3_HYPHA